MAEPSHQSSGMVNQPFEALQVNPTDLIATAVAEYAPVARLCLFSGGHDSTVLAHRCSDHYDKLAHIDTGTAVPGVREYVEEFAAWLDKPLVVYEAGDAFRRLVLEHGGFPGPAGHGRAYTRLKERQIEAMVRDHKQGHSRRAKVLLLTGKRRAESARRARTTLGIEARGGQLYVNPLVDWTSNDMRAYRTAHALPESPVAALLGMSGECGCGAFASDGEWEMRKALFPEWARPIEELERNARDAGVRACQWGGFDVDGNQVRGVSDEEVGPLCDSCVWRQQALDGLAA